MPTGDQPWFIKKTLDGKYDQSNPWHVRGHQTVQSREPHAWLALAGIPTCLRPEELNSVASAGGGRPPRQETEAHETT